MNFRVEYYSDDIYTHIMFMEGLTQEQAEKVVARQTVCDLATEMYAVEGEVPRFYFESYGYQLHRVINMLQREAGYVVRAEKVMAEIEANDFKRLDDKGEFWVKHTLFGTTALLTLDLTTGEQKLLPLSKDEWARLRDYITKGE